MTASRIQSSILNPWQPGHPVWQLGFRPFYLLAALFAAVSIPLLLASYMGVSTGPLQVGMGWHMHEMVFGFAVAVVMDFLFTAGRNWTGLPTSQGWHLMALAAVWLAGRVAMLAASAPVAAAIDMLFLPLSAWPLFLVLQRSGNHRNLFLVGLLALLTLANGLYHVAAMGMLSLSYFVPVQAAIFIIVLIESVIGARVIPMFTRNGAPGGRRHVAGHAGTAGGGRVLVSGFHLVCRDVCAVSVAAQGRWPGRVGANPCLAAV